MAANCPKCKKPIDFWQHRKKPFPCRSCGVSIKAYFPEKSFIKFIVLWMILGIPAYFVAGGIGGRLLDFVLGGIIFSVIYSYDAKIHLADAIGSAEEHEKPK